MVTRLPAHGWRRFTVRRVIDCKFFTGVYVAERKEIVAVVAADIWAFALPWLIQIPSNRQSVKGRWTPIASISDDGKIFVQLSNSLWVFGNVRRLDPKHLLVVSLKQRTFLLDFPDCKYAHSTLMDFRRSKPNVDTIVGRAVLITLGQSRGSDPLNRGDNCQA
jgi:hypothetical protein